VRRWLWILAVLGLATGCAEATFEESPQLPFLRTLMAEVEPQRLIDEVQGLVEAHQSDTPLDCASLGLPDDDRVCHHSRVAAGQRIRSTLESLGAVVTEQVQGEGAFRTRNLVVELPGTGRPNEVVLIGAHYDSFYGGADDNSSGVAAMVELYRLLSTRTLDRTVRFVWFDFEEFGFIGSERYVAELDSTQRIVTALVFDCIGYSDTTPGSQEALPGFPTPSEGDFIALIGNQTSKQQITEAYALNSQLEVLRAAAVVSPSDGAFPITGPLLRSDHSVFWLDGLPAIFLTDTARLRNPHYHQVTDTADTLDPVFFANVVRLSAAAVAHWAGAR